MSSNRTSSDRPRAIGRTVSSAGLGTLLFLLLALPLRATQRMVLAEMYTNTG